MKNDARLLLNKKKWKKESGNAQPEVWKSRGTGTVDARKILNLKRRQNSKSIPTVLGSYMRTKNATSFIASQIRKEISPIIKPPNKLIHLSRDGNIIVTSKPKKPQSSLIQPEPSTSDMDDLEYTTVDDVLDFDSLPPALVASKSVQNLSRKSVVSQILEKKHTMVADQLSENVAASFCTKVYASNLHPTVSREDVMELFGDVGIIKNVEMIRPGTAVIDFYDESDAEKACDLYHNRLLDGLPMKCYLQSGAQSRRSTISQRLGERIMSPTSIPGPSSYVATNSRSRYNPRNVQFTVKLT